MESARRRSPASRSKTGKRGRNGNGAVLKLVERRENSLMSLFELSHELGVGLDPYDIAQLSLFSLMGHFGTATAALWLRADEAVGDVVLTRTFGLSEDAGRALGPMLAAHAANLIEKGAAPARLADWVEAGLDEARAAIGQGVAVVAPVPAHGRMVGVIALGQRLAGESYGALDLEYLAAAAGMVGVALENARLYHGMVESNRQLRDSNQRLAELDQLKSEFLQNVNHELLTPLTVIVAYLDVLQQKASLDEEGRNVVEVAVKQSKKLGEMVQTLLDFSKLRQESLSFEIESCDLAALLTGYAQGRRPGVANGLREFTLHLEPRLPAAACDPRRLVQVLDELVDNAVKFTPPGSHVRLRAAHRRDENGDWVTVAVEDDGPGIPADRLAPLFEAFRQGDGSTTREAGGLGLGLAFARRLAEGMGGGLEAMSQVGVGSAFTVRLKVA